MSAYTLSIESNNIISYLSKIDTENTSIQSGQSTIFDKMPTLLTTIISIIDASKNDFLTTYLTPSQIISYNNGSLILSDTINHSLIDFYNVLQKLYLMSTIMLGNILATPNQSTISFYANADNYTLTTDQFEGSASNKILNNSTFEYYTIQMGDTSRIIANRSLGKPEQYISILQINNITESQLISGELVGTQIKIPIDSSLVSQNKSNLVYENDFTDPEKFQNGSDIAIGINNTVEVSATGDILGASGLSVTTNSIANRLNTVKGTLNVFSSNFGLKNIGESNAPLMVQINNYLTDFVNQIQEDPRVQSVQLNTNSIKWDGEVLSASATVTYLGSDQTQVVTI